jgi:hypothetical protein
MVYYTELIKHFGVLGIVILFTWKAAPVVWTEVTKWSDRGLRFLDHLETTQESTVKHLHDQRQQSERHEELSWRVWDKLEEVDEKCDRIIERMGMAASEPRRSRRRRHQQPNDPGAPPPAPGVSPPTSPPTSSAPPSSS